MKTISTAQNAAVPAKTSNRRQCATNIKMLANTKVKTEINTSLRSVLVVKFKTTVEHTRTAELIRTVQILPKTTKGPGPYL